MTAHIILIVVFGGIPSVGIFYFLGWKWLNYIPKPKAEPDGSA